MKDRIKQVRQHKDINLSQEAFGKKLGVTGTAISRIENGNRGASDQIVLAICREFNVNEDWLRTGKGAMFAPQSREDAIAAAVRKIASGRSEDFKRRFVTALAGLSEEHWELLEQKMLEIVGDRPIPEAPPDYEAEARAEAEKYYQEVILEKKRAEESSASENSGGDTKLA